MRLRFGGLRGGAPKAGVLKRPASVMQRPSSASAGSGHWPVSDSAVPAPVFDSADTDPAGEAGKLSLEEKKKLHAEKMRKYRQTPEGKAAAKAARERYNEKASGKAKAKAASTKYQQSDKGKAVAKKYGKSDKGKARASM